jgi:hypothetical protein
VTQNPANKARSVDAAHARHVFHDNKVCPKVPGQRREGAVQKILGSTWNTLPRRAVPLTWTTAEDRIEPTLPEADDRQYIDSSQSTDIRFKDGRARVIVSVRLRGVSLAFSRKQHVPASGPKTR